MKMTCSWWISVAVVLVMALALPLPSSGKDTYQPTWESLAKHNPAPEWFRNAKFGIYFHWGVYSVPAFGSEWYPRNMHFKNTKEYKHHLETYGDPADFGYHDFVPMFKAEKFNADEWVDLFIKAGARFAGPVAEHHDGFSMWASKVNPWNVKDMGPKRDISGELEKAIRARGLKFVATFHHARNLQRPSLKGEPYPSRRHYWASHYPPIEGWPTSSTDPLLRILYGHIPEKQFLKNWKQKLIEFVDNYHPDLIWFDSWLDQIPEKVRQEFLAYYYNQAEKRGQEVVVTFKQEDLPLNTAVLDLEKGRMNRKTELPWLTDDTISMGSWCYTQNLKIKPTNLVLHVFIDIVSKNGQLLLNISPKADGTIPDNQKDVLLGMGKWLKKYGEAIYGTRPWIVFGEGPTRLKKGGGFTRHVEYGPQDIRFTQKGDTLYAIVLGLPENTITIQSLSTNLTLEPRPIEQVSLLGFNSKLNWLRHESGLTIEMPNLKQKEPDLAYVFKIQFKKQ